MSSSSASLPASLIHAVQALDQHLAEEIRILEVRDVSSVTDFFVIATGTGVPHLRALASEVEKACKNHRVRARRKGGSPFSGWMVIDFADVVVHVMTRELREFYALEQLWSDGKTVDAAALLSDQS
ncbi:MAG: ribosome silencing factor [Verrucomicrobia bacterium]|nr:ribosome silencing factor [Verrucomicrobiota bacterium]MCH8513300.1 ribosome silencing factor [Kiritimatiellia bacterium]